MICAICGGEYKNFKSLSNHCRKHKITSRKYYDTFLRKENEGLCKVCGEETSFNFKSGYRIYCSINCNNKNADTRLRRVEQCKKTMLRKYGIEWPFQLNVGEQVQKRKLTCLNKYGVDNVSKLDTVKEKIKNTFLENYGVDHNTKSKQVRDKYKETILERYGVEHFSKTFKFRSSCSDRMLNGGAIRALHGNRKRSQPQLKLFNLTKNLFSASYLEYPVLNYSIDVAIPSFKIAIEYDEPYWHQDKEKEAKRQSEIEQQGWTFIRFQCRIPNGLELVRKIKVSKMERVGRLG